MPTTPPAGLRLGIIEPQDAAAAFARRSLLQPSFRWQDVWQDEHTRAFAVAGVQRLDVLQIFHDEIEAALADGRSLADFRKAIRPQLVAKGWWGDVEITDPQTGEQRIGHFDDRRLGLIFDVNMRQSQAAGRWARIERNKKRFPYVMYRTMQDERVRASHRPWNGVTLPVDHPFWQTHFPPCGWRCRCTAFAVDQRDIDRRRARGEEIKTEPPPESWITYVNPSTGEVAPIPRGVDPGFAHNPGMQARDAALYESSLRKALDSYPLSAAVAVARATQDHSGFVSAATAEFGSWVTDVLASARPAGELRYVGTIAPQAVRAMSTHGIEPASAVVAVRDTDVLHALRSSKADAGVGVPAALYGRLPELLQRANALLLEKDAQPPALLYVVDLVADDGSVAKLVIKLDMPVRMRLATRKGLVPMNIVRTATVMDGQALGDTTRYKLLWGRLQ